MASSRTTPTSVPPNNTRQEILWALRSWRPPSWSTVVGRSHRWEEALPAAKTYDFILLQIAQCKGAPCPVRFYFSCLPVEHVVAMLEVWAHNSEPLARSDGSERGNPKTGWFPSEKGGLLNTIQSGPSSTKDRNIVGFTSVTSKHSNSKLTTGNHAAHTHTKQPR